MQLSYQATIVIFATLLNSVVAVPVPQEETLLRRNGNTCSSQHNTVFKQWSINIVDDAKYNKSCGGGCLDNLRGRCGAITAWGCSMNGNVASYSFNTQSFCSENDVQAAIMACTRGERKLQCTATNHPVTDFLKTAVNVAAGVGGKGRKRSLALEPEELD